MQVGYVEFEKNTVTFYSKIDENRYKQKKYRLIRILGVIAMPYSLQSLRYYM